MKDLADILHDSGLVEDDVIKTYLGVSQFRPIEFSEPEKSDNLKEWEIARLAGEIDVNSWEDIAAKYFWETLTSAEIGNIRSDNRGDALGSSFDILLKFCRKTKNNRQVYG